MNMRLLLIVCLTTLLNSVAAYPKNLEAYSGARKIPHLSCRTVSGEGCVFPFHYNGKVHKHCTTEDNAEGRGWCPYQVRVHDDGTRTMTKWDYCNTNVCVVVEAPKKIVKMVETTTTEAPETTTVEATTTEEDNAETTQAPAVPLTKKAMNDTVCMTESGPASGRVCKFPFKFHGQTHNSCIRWTTPGVDYGKYWCFTETSEHDGHLSPNERYGFCGFCDNPACGCSMHPMPRLIIEVEPEATTTEAVETTTEAETTTEGAQETTTVVDEHTCLTEDEKLCQFPFKFRGEEYTSCPVWKWPGKNHGKYWCSTKTDDHGNHMKGNFGICQDTFSCVSP